MRWRVIPIITLAVAVLLAGCAAPRTTSVAPNGAEPPRPTAPKRIVAAIYGDLPLLRSQINTVTPGVVEIERQIAWHRLIQIAMSGAAAVALAAASVAVVGGKAS